MTSKPTILYVDDNPRSRRLLSSLLEDCEVEVLAVADPNQALELSRNRSFNLAVVDYEMPRMTGTELAQKMKTIRPHLPVILLSGGTPPEPHELISVDVHFGAGTSLGDLFGTVRAFVELNHLRGVNALRPAQWADST